MKKNREIEDFLADVLPKVSRPGRYIGGEVNTLSELPKEDDIRFALAFPELYEIGMSHKGLAIIYSILNSTPGVYAERVFAPWPDMEAEMRGRGVELFSLETKTPLRDFHIIGFSLMYELTYTNAVNMLKLANIPPLSKERDESYPLIIAGGAQSLSPEPVADLFDAFIVGDGEEAAVDFVETIKRIGFDRGKRERLLRTLEGIRGVYVPRFYEPRYEVEQEGREGDIEGIRGEIYSGIFYTDGKGVAREVGGDGGGDLTVKRRILKDINSGPILKRLPKSTLVSHVKAVHDRVSVEIARGCGRGCRFCQAGYVNRPVRERTADNVFDIATETLALTGMGDLSLLSLSATDHSDISTIMERLMSALKGEVGERSVALSVPSVRVDTLSPAIIEEIKKVKKTGFTIAPEAGSQKLRDVINKNITEEEIEETIDAVFDAGWRLIKLYFMIGLPTETDEDIEALITLVRRAARRIAGTKGGRINVAVSTFVPKPHTPFQWEPFIGIKEIRRKQEMIRSGLSGEKVKLKFHDPGMSLVEAAFARGDRRLTDTILRASELGCRFDGWTEHFDIDLWVRAFRDSGLDIYKYAGIVPDRSAPLPWDHIDSGIDLRFLLEELEKAFSGETTPDCVRGGCAGCGVCVGDISNVVGGDSKASSGAVSSSKEESTIRERERFKYLLLYSRMGDLRFLSHLETASLIERALLRASLPLAFSEGFNPKPKIGFGSALPVGVEAAAEPFFVELSHEVGPDDIMSRVNEILPKGVEIVYTRGPVHDVKKLISEMTGPAYEITLNGAGPDFESRTESVSAFLDKEEAWYHDKKKGREKKIDVRRYVESIETLKNGGGMRLKMRKINGSSPSPFKVISTIFGIPEGETRSLSVIKEGILDEMVGSKG